MKGSAPPVPALVLSAALYERFSSCGENPIAYWHPAGV